MKRNGPARRTLLSIGGAGYETRPAGCRNEIYYIWGGPRTTVVPRAVHSSIAVFDDEADAREAMKVREQIEFLVRESPAKLMELPELGPEAVRFRGDRVPVGAGVLWRNGKALAVDFAGGQGLQIREPRKG